MNVQRVMSYLPSSPFHMMLGNTVGDTDDTLFLNKKNHYRISHETAGGRIGVSVHARVCKKESGQLKVQFRFALIQVVWGKIHLVGD